MGTNGLWEDKGCSSSVGHTICECCYSKIIMEMKDMFNILNLIHYVINKVEFLNARHLSIYTYSNMASCLLK